MSAPSKQERLVVALLNRASITHRLSILDRLSAYFEIVSERSLRLSLPEDDILLRSLLAHEIETEGEAETLVKWALKFTSTINFFFVLQVKSAASSSDLFELFLNEHAPKLREAYGQDEIYFSPDRTIAEMQIDLLFPELNSPTDALAHQLESATLESPPMTQATTSSSEASGSAFSQHSISTIATSAPSVRPQSRASLHPTSQPSFKARPIPSTVSSKPSIQPRLSKAAALRMGVEISSPLRTRTAASPTKPVGDVGISGVAKKPVALPASLRAPTIAPRLNKAAVARQGGAIEEVVRRPSLVAAGSRPSTAGSSHKPFPSAGSDVTSVMEAGARARKEVDFSNTPGHKRLSLAGTSIASIAPPSIAPRQNRASMSRISGSTPSSSVSAGKCPPSSYKASIAARDRASSLATPAKQEGGVRERQPISFDQTPGHKRASLSLSIPSLAAPSMAPRQNRASLARTRPSLSHTNAIVSPKGSTKPLPSPQTRSGGKDEGEKENKKTDFASVPGHKRHSLSFSLASLKAPSIQPRLNRAAGARIEAGGVTGAKRS